MLSVDTLSGLNFIASEGRIGDDLKSSFDGQTFKKRKSNRFERVWFH